LHSSKKRSYSHLSVIPIMLITELY